MLTLWDADPKNTSGSHVEPDLHYFPNRIRSRSSRVHRMPKRTENCLQRRDHLLILPNVRLNNGISNGGCGAPATGAAASAAARAAAATAAGAGAGAVSAAGAAVWGGCSLSSKNNV